MVVKIAGGEGSQGFAVDGVGGGGSRFDDVALVQLEFDGSRYILLSLESPSPK